MKKQPNQQSLRKSRRLAHKAEEQSQNYPKTPSNPKTHSTTTSKKQRKRSKSIGRQFKNSAKTVRIGADGYISRSEYKKLKSIQRNEQRKRDRKRDKKILKQQQAKHSKDLQVINFM